MVKPKEPLRIAITVDPEIPVPPKLYGGIERIVDMLVRGLTDRGHSVTLFAHPESSALCDLASYPALRSRGKVELLRNMWHVSSKILLGRFDVVHSFARLAYLLPILPLTVPKIMSYQRGITPSSVAWGNRLSRDTLHFTGCSRYQLGDFARLSNCHVVYNGVPANGFRFQDGVADSPLVFLGRLEEFKGPQVAIKVAQLSGRKLIIAGNIPEGDSHREFFEKEILPHVDDEFIKYVGSVNDVQKNDLLGQAGAFLMPLLGREAFGIVMAEALACGTPVIGFNKGPIPEIVQDGINGFLCASIEEMVDAVRRIDRIDRRQCRTIMEEKFSDRAIVDDYLKLYKQLINKNGSDVFNQ